jgi:nitroreductase
MGREPWEFVVITDAASRRQIADLTDYGRFIAQAPACVAVFCRDVRYYLEDGCAAVENLLIAACALGLGACWVAGDKKPYARAVGELLRAPQDMKLIALVALGYARGPLPARQKRPLQEVIHWERF